MQVNTIYIIEKGVFKAAVELAGSKASAKKGKKGAQTEETKMLGADDVEMVRKFNGVPMFTEEEMDNIDTSVCSSRKQSKILASGSMTTVLAQALNAEDQESIDFVFSQKELAHSTLTGIKEPKQVHALL